MVRFFLLGVVVGGCWNMMVGWWCGIVDIVGKVVVLCRFGWYLCGFDDLI